MVLFPTTRDSFGSALPFPSHSEHQQMLGHPAESFGTRSSSAFEEIVQHSSKHRFLAFSVHKKEGLA